MSEFDARAIWRRIRRYGWIVTANGCWEWRGPINSDGYGRLGVNGRDWRLSRLIVTLSDGPIPAGMVVRHDCDNPLCFRREHLRLGTQADNSRDMMERGRHHSGASSTACAKGHTWAPGTWSPNSGGGRRCKICNREAAHAYYVLHRDEINARTRQRRAKASR